MDGARQIQFFEIQFLGVVQKSKFMQPSINPEIQKSTNPNFRGHPEIQKSRNPNVRGHPEIKKSRNPNFRGHPKIQKSNFPGIQKPRNPTYPNAAISPKSNFRLSPTNPKWSAHPKIKGPAPVQESGNPNYAARAPPLPPHGGGRRPLPPNTHVLRLLELAFGARTKPFEAPLGLWKPTHPHRPP